MASVLSAVDASSQDFSVLTVQNTNTNGIENVPSW